MLSGELELDQAKDAVGCAGQPPQRTCDEPRDEPRDPWPATFHEPRWLCSGLVGSVIPGGASSSASRCLLWYGIGTDLALLFLSGSGEGGRCGLGVRRPIRGGPHAAKGAVSGRACWVRGEVDRRLVYHTF